MAHAPHLRVVEQGDAGQPVRILCPRGEENLDLKNPLHQEIIGRHLDRVWRAYLGTPGEFIVLSWIINQTVSVSRANAHFTYRVIGEGNSKTAGTGYGRRHLMRITQALEEAQFIIVHRDNWGIWVGPNLRRIVDEQREAVPKTPMGKRRSKHVVPSDATTSPTLGVRMRQRPTDRTTLKPASLESTMRRRFHLVRSREAWNPWTEEQKSTLSRVLSQTSEDQCELMHEFFEWIASSWGLLYQSHSIPKDPEIEFIMDHMNWLYEIRLDQKDRSGPRR